jgi:hypothetical protein
MDHTHDSVVGDLGRERCPSNSALNQSITLAAPAIAQCRRDYDATPLRWVEECTSGRPVASSMQAINPSKGIFHLQTDCK